MYDIRNLNIWKQEEKKDRNLRELRDLELSDINLSVRSYNCLKRANCNTVGDILDLMDEEGNGLRSIRNLGSRSETEIKEILEELKKEYHARPAAPSAPTQRLVFTPRRMMVAPAKRTMERPIEDFHLSRAACGRFRDSGIRYVKDLYADRLPGDPGWTAVRELFERILAQ